jgi:hypothetical protein
MNVQSLSEYRSRPKGWSYTDSDEFADSDRDELPDAPNVTKSNAPMAIAGGITFLLLVLLVVWLVGVHFKS